MLLSTLDSCGTLLKLQQSLLSQVSVRSDYPLETQNGAEEMNDEEETDMGEVPAEGR